VEGNLGNFNTAKASSPTQSSSLPQSLQQDPPPCTRLTKSSWFQPSGIPQSLPSSANSPDTQVTIVSHSSAHSLIFFHKFTLCRNFLMTFQNMKLECLIPIYNLCSSPSWETRLHGLWWSGLPSSLPNPLVCWVKCWCFTFLTHCQCTVSSKPFQILPDHVICPHVSARVKVEREGI
jgi:hypothetical protein